MEIIEEKQIEHLIKNGVIIATQAYLLKDSETRQKIGEMVRKSYGNWNSDRERLTQEEPPEIVHAVMAIWGDTPSIEEPKNTSDSINRNN